MSYIYPIACVRMYSVEKALYVIRLPVFSKADQSALSDSLQLVSTLRSSKELKTKINHIKQLLNAH